MTRRPPVVDELRARTRRLEAERLRPEQSAPRTEPAWADDFRCLLLILRRLLTNPGPPDSAPVDPKASQ